MVMAMRCLGPDAKPRATVQATTIITTFKTQDQCYQTGLRKVGNNVVPGLSHRPHQHQDKQHHGEGVGP